MKRVPSVLDDAITAAQRKLGRVPDEESSLKRKAVNRPSLLELNYKSKPRISLTVNSPKKTSWLTKNEDDSLEKTDMESRKSNEGPIWKLALNELNTNKNNNIDNLKTVEEKILWPPILSTNSAKTIENWYIVEENRQLTKTIESIIERPGSHLNPIHIMGTMGVGKTHISLATSYEIQTLYGYESVRIIRSNSIVNTPNELPKMPQDIPNLRMILVEDFEELNENPSRMQIVCNWLIWNVNNGIQIIITSNGSIDYESIGGDARRLLDSSIVFNIEKYTNVSKMRILRRLAMERNVVLSDEHLSILISTKNNFPSLLSAFEKFIIAQKDGTLPTNPEEAIASLDSVQSVYNTMFSDDIIDTAKNIALKAVETTELSEFKLDENAINVELNMEDIPDIGDINSQAKKMSDEDSKLISKWNENLNLPIESPDSEKLLEELSEHGLDRMADVGVAFDQYNEILNSIEQRIKNISKSLEGSDTETLLQLADEMSDLEYSLQDLKPLISSLNKLQFTTKPAENSNLPDLEKLKKLDEYTPETDWNIDSETVSMEDLLNEVELTPVKYPVLIPMNHEKSMDPDNFPIMQDSVQHRSSDGKYKFDIPEKIEDEVKTTKSKRKEEREKIEMERKTAEKAKLWRQRKEARSNPNEEE